MKGNISLPELKLTAHSKLIYQISRNVRAIFMDYDAQKRLVIFLAYFQSPPTELEEESIADAASETAVEHYIDSQSKAVYSTASFRELEKLPYWLFVRAEELDDISEEE